jgi:BirA family biotin operon repressor/biotin-[acetyl-CoA-carboxylase] ligase
LCRIFRNTYFTDIRKGVGDFLIVAVKRCSTCHSRSIVIHYIKRKGVNYLLAEIQKQLAGHPWQDKIIWLDTIDSTNTYAKELARKGAPEGTVVIADHQANGRGRMGRSFSSPAGMGIYMSVILRPDCLPEELMHLTCATGLYACLAVENAAPTVIPPRIKWANDLVIGSRKLGGILTELSVDPQSGKVDWTVIGIGINCCQKEKDFPPEIREIACSLDMTPSDRCNLIAELIRQLYCLRQDIFTEKSLIMESFFSRCVTIGKRISIVRGDTIQHGKATSLDQDGALGVQLDDGQEVWINSGEVSIRGMYGYV